LPSSVSWSSLTFSLCRLPIVLSSGYPKSSRLPILAPVLPISAHISRLLVPYPPVL
jgi:hypothetical protein